MSNIFGLTTVASTIWLITNVFAHWTNKQLNKKEKSNTNNFTAAINYTKKLYDNNIENDKINKTMIELISHYKNYTSYKIKTDRKKIIYSTINLIIIAISWITLLISKNPIWELYPIISLLIIDTIFTILFMYKEHNHEKIYSKDSNILIRKLIDYSKIEITSLNKNR